MSGIVNHLLSLALLVPIVGICAVLLTGSGRAGRARWLALLFSVASVVTVSALWFLYDPDGKTWQFAERFNVAPAMGVSVYLGVDGASILFLLLTGVVTLAAVLASWNETRAPVPRFYAWLLLAQAGTVGVFIALDLLVFFVGWQVTFGALYVLIRNWTGRIGIGSSRFFYGWMGVSGVMLAAMAALYFANPNGASPYSSDITLLHTRTLSPSLQSWVFMAFLLAFGATMSLFPLQRWIVEAQTMAPTGVSMLIASLMTKLGAYGVFRLLLPVAPDACRQVAPIVAWIAIAGMLCGALLAWRERDLKRLMAYATVSQLGLMMIGLFALTPVGIGSSLAQQTGHAFWIAGLFVCVDILYQRAAITEISLIGGLRGRMPMFTALFSIMLLSATGIFTAFGFLNEATGLRGVAADRGWVLVGAAGMFLSVVYLLPVVRRLFSGEVSGRAGSWAGLSRREVTILILLAAFAVGSGVYPVPVLQRVETSVGRVVARIHPEMAPYLRLGSDCPTAAPPDPAGPPPGFILVEPCAEGQ